MNELMNIDEDLIFKQELLKFKQNILNTYAPELEKRASEIKEIYTNFISHYTNNELNAMYKNYWYYQNKPEAFVYLIYNEYTKLTKIGCSNNPIKRLKQLNSMFKNHFGIDGALKLIGVIYIANGNMKKIEKEYHDLFKSKEKYGEWFKLNKKDLDNIFSYSEYITDQDTNEDIFIDKEILLDGVNLSFKPTHEINYYVMALKEIIHDLELIIDKSIICYAKDTLEKYMCDRLNIDFNYYKNILFGTLLGKEFNNELFNMFEFLYQNEVSIVYKIELANDCTHFVRHVITFRDKNFNNVIDYLKLVNQYVDNYFKENI